MANTNAAGIQQLSSGSDSGVSLGQSASDLIGFYGATPIAQGTITLGAGTTTTLLKADVLAIATALANLGLTVTA